MLVDKVDAELKRLNEILRKRGIFFEDEAGEHLAYSNVAQWMREDKDTKDQIEADSAAAEKPRANYSTRELLKPKVNFLRKEL